MKKFLLLLAVCLLLTACAQEEPPRSTPENPAAATSVQPGSAASGQTQDHLPSPQAAKGIRFTFDHEIGYASGKEAAQLTARDADGNTLWVYSTAAYEPAQMERITDIGLWRDRYYLVEDGAVIALDARTGDLLWKNKDFDGCPALGGAWIDDKTGNVYLTGYFGPDFFATDWQGTTLHRTDTIHPSYWWGYGLEEAGDFLLLRMEGHDSGDSPEGGYRFYIPKLPRKIADADQAGVLAAELLGTLRAEPIVESVKKAEGGYAITLSDGHTAWVSEAMGAIYLP